MFAFTPKQLEAQEIFAGPATHILMYGGSRSGKTFLTTRNVVMRGLKAPVSRHAIFRFRFNAIKSSIVLDTFPKVMREAFPGVEYELNKSDLFATLPNGSEIWFGGLDDKDRTEKILGNEYSTMYFNECSQIPYGSINIALTRLAQLSYTKIEGQEPQILSTRAYYDANPPNKSHWLYRKFIQKIDPESKQQLSNPDDYVSFRMNPFDNAVNLNPKYLEGLQDLPARLKRRFLLGEFADATPNALFPEEWIDKYRVGSSHDEALPDMVRIVVGVDPSGSGDTDNADNDAIGIVVVGLATDGNAYVLEDCTIKAGPATWAKVATSAFERHSADVLVAEKNYGGAMVEQTIKAARPQTPVKMVTSSRGKILRAEPFSTLYEKGKVRHAGMFVELEDEMTGFGTNGYTGQGSPNRVDALVFCLAELFPGMTRGAEVKIKLPNYYVPTGQWDAL